MSEENTNLELATLVLSCDKYKDLWVPFSHFLKTRWRQYPWNIYLLANEECFQDSRIVSIQTGKDRGWSDSLISALNQLNSKYVFFLHEDTFVLSPYEADIFRRAVSFLEKVGGTCVKLCPVPCPDVQVVGETAFGQLSSQIPYRNNLFMSIWNRSRLLSYLQPGETAWDFETIGRKRSECDKAFYAAWEHHFDYLNAVIKGRWVPSALDKVRSEIPGYTTTLPVMSRWEELVFKAYCIARKAFIGIFGVRAFKAIHEKKWRGQNPSFSP
jgi:hypothetical protein